jgi:hypothetical protein
MNRGANKGMKLTTLSAAWLPEWTCRLMPAPVNGMDAGTASQLIPGVQRTQEGDGMVTAEVFDPLGARRLNEVEWHDSVLLSLEFDRAVERRDELRLHLLVLVDLSTWESEEWRIDLVGCRAVRIGLNGGVECLSEGEMIDTLEIQTSGDLVSEVQRTWSGLSLPPLGQMTLRLASTGSHICAVFEAVRVSHEGAARAHPAPVRLGPRAE